MSPQEETAERAIIDTERAGEDYAVAADLEEVLENARPLVKDKVVQRLISPGPEQEIGKVGGESVKMAKAGLSPSAAEKAATSDPEYLAHLDQKRLATLKKNRAYNRMVSARLRALLAVTRLAGDLEMAMDMELVRARTDDREQMVGGVPR